MVNCHTTDMKKFSPAFDFYPERFWFAVEGWTDSEIVRYWRLLSQQWMRDGLPTELSELQELARGKVSERVLQKFPIAADGRRRNTFMEKGRADQMERMAASKFKNTRAAWLKHHKNEPIPQHLETRKAFDEWVACGMPESSHRDATGMPQGGIKQELGIAQASPPTHHSPLTTSFKTTTPRASAGSWPTEDEVAKYGVSVMAPLECCAKFWNEMEACGWVNRHGHPLTDWRALFRNYVTTWKANEHRDKQRGQANGKPSIRDQNGQREGEIPTDVTVDKIPRITPRNRA